MPVQVQQSNVAARFGARIAGANEAHKDKPIDTGIQRLPPGINDGVAKLQVMTMGVYKDDKMGPNMKGQEFFRAAAVVVHPIEHGGRRCAGIMHTSVVVPICDVPARGQRKASTFEDNWFAFQNVFKLVSNGAVVCPETKATDPTGQKTWAFYQAAMKALTDPQRPPIYITFSTRGWTPPKTAQQPNPEEMVFETWHGLATPAQVAVATTARNPAAGVTIAGNGQPSPTDMAPDGLPFSPANITEKDPPLELADEVAMLVEIAMNDSQGATQEGQDATARLEELAWQAGWTREQTDNPPKPFTNDWAGVGDMALIPQVGGEHRFAKRDTTGGKLKNSEGQEFPALEVVVVSVDEKGKTCTLKTAKDGKDVIDIKTRKPLAVKWEWLESCVARSNSGFGA